MSGELESQLQAVSSAQGPPLPLQHHTPHQTHPQPPQQQPIQQTQQQSQDAAADFVSSVCWKKVRPHSLGFVIICTVVYRIPT